MKEEVLPLNKKRGDRKDGVRIRDIDGLHAIMPHLMPQRCESEVYINETIDVTNLMDYLRKKNGPEAEYKTTAFHVITTAVAKTVYHRPLLNRFIAGKRFYMRNDITLAFIVKRQFNDNAEESMLITKVDGDTTLEKMSRRIIGDTTAIRKEGGNDINDLLDDLAKLPRFVMRFSCAYSGSLIFTAGCLKASAKETATTPQYCCRTWAA